MDSFGLIVEQRLQEHLNSRIHRFAARASSLLVVAGLCLFGVNFGSMALWLNAGFALAFLALVFGQWILVGHSNPNERAFRQFGRVILGLGLVWGFWLALSTQISTAEQIVLFVAILLTLSISTLNLASHPKTLLSLNAPLVLGFFVLQVQTELLSFWLLIAIGVVIVAHSASLAEEIRRAYTVRARDEIRFELIQKQNELMFEHSNARLLVSTAKELLKCTPAATQMLGLGQAPVLLDLWHGLRIDRKNWHRLHDRLYKKLLRSGLVSLSVRFRLPDDRIVWVEANGRFVDPFAIEQGVIWQLTDATKRREQEERNLFLANYCGLTSLWNRAAFTSEVTNRFVKAHSDQGQLDQTAAAFGFLVFDLDFFRRINDTYGYVVGDAVMKIFAQRLIRSTRASDLVGRLGGDEFGVLLSAIATREELIVASRKIVDACVQPLFVEDQKIEIGASLGTALWPQDGADLATLMQVVNTQIIETKQASRGLYRRILSGHLI